MDELDDFNPRAFENNGNSHNASGLNGLSAHPPANASQTQLTFGQALFNSNHTTNNNNNNIGTVYRSRVQTCNFDQNFGEFQENGSYRFIIENY